MFRVEIIAVSKKITVITVIIDPIIDQTEIIDPIKRLV
jgi:hypothetical protein